jgi:hypothetical protein
MASAFVAACGSDKTTSPSPRVPTNIAGTWQLSGGLENSNGRCTILATVTIAQTDSTFTGTVSSGRMTCSPIVLDMTGVTLSNGRINGALVSDDDSMGCTFYGVWQSGSSPVINGNAACAGTSNGSFPIADALGIWTFNSM